MPAPQCADGSSAGIRRVVGADPDILVHVEHHRVGPGDPGRLLDQRAYEGELGVPGGEHHVGDASGLHRRPHDAQGLVGRCTGHGLGVGMDPDGRAVHDFGPDLHGVQHARCASGQTGPVRDVVVPGPAHMEAAWRAVRRFLPVTPAFGTPQLGPSVSVKIETLQPTGSFKVRGGLAAVSATLEQDPGRDVVASSAGNHGLGLAYASSKLGARVTVIVPTGASAAKVSALQQFDVRLVLHGDGYREAETHTLELAASEGSRYVSPYNDPDVIAGQSTLARELLEQVPNLGTVIVPCGGGGLLSGVILGLEGSGVRVMGIESEASSSMSTALAAGGIVPINVEPTVADGLAGNLEPGAVTVEHRTPARRGGPHGERGRHPLCHGLRGHQDGPRARGRGSRRRRRVAGRRRAPRPGRQGDCGDPDRSQRGTEAAVGGAPFLKSPPMGSRSTIR